MSLSGRGAHPAARRGLLAVLGVIVLLALLDVFGQHPSTSRASSSCATLEVQSPRTLRGGLISQTRITVRARTAATRHARDGTLRGARDSGRISFLVKN